VHGADVVGGEAAGVADGPGGGEVHVVDEHDDDVAAQDRCLAGPGGADLELALLGLVLAVQPQEHEHPEGRMITIVHAPSVNFVTMITMSTMNESTAAVPLMMARRRHCGSFVRRWYFTMPARPW